MEGDEGSTRKMGREEDREGEGRELERREIGREDGMAKGETRAQPGMPLVYVCAFWK